MCLYFLFFFSKNSSYLSPPGTNKHLASHTAQPGSLPRILLQTLWPRLGASATLFPVLVPGTLLSLSTLLTVSSFNVLYLWSLFFISARRFTGAEGKWTQLPPISSPSSPNYQYFDGSSVECFTKNMPPSAKLPTSVVHVDWL